MKQFFTCLTLFTLLLALSPKHASGQWVQTNGPFSGNISSILSMDSELFASTLGQGVFRSTNRGLTWSGVNSGLNDLNIRALVSVDSILFVGTYQHSVFRSTDHGSNWISMNNGIGENYSITALCVNGKDLCASDGWNVYLTTDKGANWQRDSSLWGLGVVTLYASGGRIFAGTSNGVYSLGNSGWAESNNGLPHPTRQAPTLYVPHVSCFAADGNYLFIGTNYGVFESAANGSNWSASSFWNENVGALKVKTHVLFAAVQDRVYSSSDHGAHWVSLDSGMSYSTTQTFGILDTSLFAGSNSAGIFIYSQSTKIWSSVSTGLAPTSVTTIAKIGDTLFAGTGSCGVFRTTDKGQHWQAINNGLLNGHITSLAVLSGQLYSGSTNSVYTPGEWTSGIFRFNDKDYWESSDSGIPYKEISAICAIGPLLIAAGTNTYFTQGGIFASRDSGRSWSESDMGLPKVSFSTLAVMETSLFAGCGSNTSIYWSSNFGTSWSTVDSGLPGVSVQGLAATEDGLYVGAWWGGGVFVSSPIGSSWRSILNGLPGDGFAYIQSLYAVGKVVIAAIYRAGRIVASQCM